MIIADKKSVVKKQIRARRLWKRRREKSAADKEIRALAAKESAIDIRFSVSDPGIAADADTEYIASYLFP